MTSTFTVQTPPAAIVPPEKEIDPAFATGANVGEPQPVVLAAGLLATTMLPGLVGKVSEKATPDIGSFRLGLVTVNVKVDIPPAIIGEGANDLVTFGGCKAVNEAVAIPFGP